MKKTIIGLLIFVLVLVVLSLVGKLADQKLSEIQKTQKAAQPAR